MDAIYLKQLLCDNVDNITKVLESIECGKIKHLPYAQEIRCALDTEYESNGNSIRVKVDKLSVVSYSDRMNFHGDIISFTMLKMDCKFIEAIKIICTAIGVDFNYKHTPSPKKQLPFSGYYKNLTKQQNLFEESITYPDSILEQFINKPSKMFLDDGISLETQARFNICYDIDSNRICCVWRDSFNRIVAILGRWNGEDYENCNEPKYKVLAPSYGFQKSRHLFGYSENYKHIQETGTVYITEAEKSVLQAHSMGIENVVAIGSHNISDIQAQLIKSLMVKKIIIAYDEDIKDIDFLKEQCKKLQYNNSFINADIGYILDVDNTYLELGSKSAPTDRGIDTFNALCEKCVHYI